MQALNAKVDRDCWLFYHFTASFLHVTKVFSDSQNITYASGSLRNFRFLGWSSFVYLSHEVKEDL